jgi:predicted membrane protein
MIMKSKGLRQGAVWGSVLILVGVLLLVETFTEVSAWMWIIVLFAGGLGAFGFYLSDRADWAMLLAAYVLWAIALLIALVSLNILRNEAVAFYVLLVIALPFLAVFYRDRSQWWALIPAYVMLVVAVMIGLIGLGILDDLLVPAYILLAIALPFFVVYVRDRRQWWLLIPGGVLALVGLSFLVAGAAFEYIGALVLILAGVVLLVRVFARNQPADEMGSSDPDVEGQRHKE